VGGERAITEELGLRRGAGMTGGEKEDRGGWTGGGGGNGGKSQRRVESLQLTRARFDKLEDK